ncbi:MAG: CSLREA domain-containing protein [Acinetobacter populi]|jgi:CSLREA domain-containing protein|uniref:CSLREA domain-containing protein n=1 Tax=Acinetobacter populi TaxID=1582270 RepID=UPI0023524CA7|nr:CSLREA domain-containing protein [Acinetobacter populi]MCH4246429.1 CSLREA domain-containing protein [Acinetobacter populi]
MKNYKKALLAISVLATFPLMAATSDDKTIYVTTFDDEDGENANACSLREALTAAYENKAYGGCSAGKTAASVTDIIQLQAGVYQITKPLTPRSLVSIYGAAATNWDEKDLITGTYPKRTALNSTIQGNGSFGLIDTTAGKATLTLNNLRLTQGKSTRGGAIQTGGALYLNRVVIDNSLATESGGAIYLAGINSAVGITDSVFSENQAPTGAVLGMSCLDNLVFTKRTITLTNSSVIKNGGTSSKSILSFCGEPTIELNANTIAENTVSNNASDGGSIIKFTGDSLPNNNSSSILSNSSSLSLISNTIVNNTAYSNFLYDSIGSKTLKYNLLAYNQGYSCRYLLGELAEGATASLSLSYNALAKSSNSDGYCYMPYDTLKDENTNTVDLSNIAQASVLTGLQAATDVTAFMPMYFLQSNTSNPLVNLGDTSAACSSEDQRGITRLADSLQLLETNNNSCDIGATELVRLSASDLSNTNSSQIALIDGFTEQKDFYQNLLDDKSTQAEFLTYYKIQRDLYAQKIIDYKTAQKYRQVYFDVFANSVPQEIQNNDGSRVIQQFSADLYTVKAEVLGTGQDVFSSGNVNNLPSENDPALRCEWNSTLQQLVMYRTDDEQSAAGDYSYCKYTIQLKSDPSIQSVGLAQASFVNIAPIAVDDEYSMKYGTDQQVDLDVLANDHDNGDGSSDQINYPAGKKAFYVYPDGVSAPIKFGTIDSNLTIVAEYSRACPDESGAMCYGGKILIKPKNSYNKFNYSITYEFFDADAKLSNTATVKLISTESSSASNSGGGSLGWLSVLALMGMAAARRYRKT